MNNEHKEWLLERQKGIGGSDVSCILGLNPYKTNIRLWEEKTGIREAEDISDKGFVKYGIEAEAPLRVLFALDYPVYDVTYNQYKIIRNAEYPFICATLDGELLNRETQKKGVLEIKTTEILRSMQKEKWNDKIPDNYFCQCIHQLLATGWDYVILKAQLKTVYGEEVSLNTRHYYIERTEHLEDLEYLQEKEIEFWEHVKNKTKPNLVLPEI